MARSEVRLEVKLNKFPKVGSRMREKLSKAIRKAAFDIEANAKDVVPVRTGNLKNSIYAATSTTSHYGKAVERVEKRKKGDWTKPIEVPAPKSDLEAIVVVGAEYGVYVEYGTRKMSARPFLRPAVEGVKDAFVEACKQAMQAN